MPKRLQSLRADLVCPSDRDPAGVYYILNTMSNRMRIGQSFRVYQRLQTHYGFLTHGTHTNKPLQVDWDAFGEFNFEFGVLVTLPERHFAGSFTDRYLLDLERHFMRVYQTKNPIYGYDFDQRPLKPVEKVYEGFFAHLERRYDSEYPA
jgi:hypothetical protein